MRTKLIDEALELIQAIEQDADLNPRNADDMRIKLLNAVGDYRDSEAHLNYVVEKVNKELNK